MLVKHTMLNVDTSTGFDVHDVTDAVQACVKQSGVRHGMVVITSQHTTTAVTINENESRLLQDLEAYVERLAPSADKYLHNDIHLRDCPQDEPQNAHAHLIAMLQGSSESIAVVDGLLMLGQWQSIMLLELDGPRTRKFSVQVMGVA